MSHDGGVYCAHAEIEEALLKQCISGPNALVLCGVVCCPPVDQVLPCEPACSAFEANCIEGCLGNSKRNSEQR